LQSPLPVYKIGGFAALLGPSMGLAPSGPPQAAFNFAPGKFVLASISSLQVGRDATYW